MKSTLVYPAVFLTCIFVCCQIKAQSSVPGRPQRSDTDLETRMRNSRNATEPKTDESRLAAKSKEVKTKLELNKDDLAKHELFLKNANTGIIKLLPQSNCGNVEEENGKKCLETNESIKVHAQNYSFREKKHVLYEKADITFHSNFFIAEKGTVQALMVSLGDVPLDNLTLLSDGVQFLSNFKPAEEAEKIAEQYEQIKNGMTAGKYTFSKALPARENATYALRSIAYSNKSISSGKNADVIVVFRVIRREDNNGVTLLWKELQQKEAPKLIFRKGN